MNDIQVLDCTLRDGGYINEWNFGQRNIAEIIGFLTDAKIDIIECGFLSNRSSYDPDKSIYDSVERCASFLPKDRKESKFVCMINYGEYSIDDIPQYDGTSIDGIRVVFHKEERDDALSFCEELSKKGYMLFIQPMVTINYSDEELLQMVRAVNNIRPFAFYIVDSFGVMKRSDLLRMVYLIDNNLEDTIKIGYHSHNNLQLAFSNAQSLVEVHTRRPRIIDSSVFGMGRGAGNLNTELFVEYLNGELCPKYRIYPLLQIIDGIINKIYNRSYWGYSLPYYLSSTVNCHPNYASFLAEKNTLTVNSISEILNSISLDKRSSFDKRYVEQLYLNHQKKTIDDSYFVNRLREEFKDKKILLIAPGKSISDYSNIVRSVSNQRDVITISVNFLPHDISVDYAFVSNEKRLDRIKRGVPSNSQGVRVILTSNLMDEGVDAVGYVSYMDLLNNTEPVRDNSALMLLRLLTKLDVKRVYLAGLDGFSYNTDDNYASRELTHSSTNRGVEELNKGMGHVLTELSDYLELDFITPTTYAEFIAVGERGPVRA